MDNILLRKVRINANNSIAFDRLNRRQDDKIPNLSNQNVLLLL